MMYVNAAKCFADAQSKHTERQQWAVELKKKSKTEMKIREERMYIVILYCIELNYLKS